MRSSAFRTFVLSLSLLETGLCLPGLHYHIPKRVAGNLDPSTTHSGSVITPAPEAKQALERRVFLAANWVTASCDPSGCVFYDVSTSSITSVNAEQLTATSGNWCFGPGCVRASSLPLGTATGTGGDQQSSTDTPSATAPFGNGTTTTGPTGPTASGNVSPSATYSSTDTTEVVSIPTQGSTAIGTGSSNSSSTETPPFSNGTDTSVTVGPPRTGPTVGTGIPPTSTTSGTNSIDVTDSATFSSGPTSLGTGTGGVSASPTLTDTTRGPFANATGTSDVQVGPTGTGLPGTGVSPEGTSTITSTNRTTVSVTTYSDDAWEPWTAATVQPAETSTTTCTDEIDSSDQQTKAAAIDSSFKSTATLSFSDTTYTVPVPASYSSDIPSPDSNEAAASSFADAVNAYPAATSAAASPVATAYPDISSSTIQPYYPGYTTTPSSSSTFDAVTFVTSSCYTSTFFDVITISSTPKMVPTAWASICYGIECNAVSSCHDWMSQVPFTDPNGNPFTTTRSGGPYAKTTTTSGVHQAAGTGTATGGGFYPSQTGTGTVGDVSSAFTDSPWPSSLNTTRNPGAYTNTAEPTASSYITSADTIPTSSLSSATVNATTLYSGVIASDGVSFSAYTTITFDALSASATSASANITAEQSPVTRAGLHPWIAWTATLETSTTTGDAASAAPTPGSYADSDPEYSGAGIRMMDNNMKLDSKNKRAAVKAGRKDQKRSEHDASRERQEKKYDGLLQKKRVEWQSEGNVEARSGESCCQGLSVYCWFVKSKVDGDC